MCHHGLGCGGAIGLLDTSCLGMTRLDEGFVNQEIDCQCSVVSDYAELGQKYM